MCNDSIKLIKKEQKVYNKEECKSQNIEFLRLNVNDEYNFGMGHVDVLDQL